MCWLKMNPGDEMNLNFESLLLESDEDENEADDIMPNISTNFVHADESCSSESDEDEIDAFD